MRFTADYDRAAVVLYAHQWAYGRNPAFYDYEQLGGDCTNFASQCVYAGSGVMNFTPTYGWYYIDSDQKAPAWTGVPFFFDFITRGAASLRIAALMDKPARRVAPLEVDYSCFQIPDAFVVGYGLDYNEVYRNLPDVGVLSPSIYGGDQ